MNELIAAAQAGLAQASTNLRNLAVDLLKATPVDEAQRVLSLVREIDEKWSQVEELRVRLNKPKT